MGIPSFKIKIVFNIPAGLLLLRGSSSTRSGELLLASICRIIPSNKTKHCIKNPLNFAILLS